MSENYIAIYLNDHLAGSSIGIDLCSVLANQCNDTAAGVVLSDIGSQFLLERNELKSIMGKLAIVESSLRKTGGWLNAKLLETKLKIEDRSKGPFFMFEGLEALSVGIAGKHLMWVCLQNLAKKNELYRTSNYGALIEQALDQRVRIEVLRDEYANAAFEI